MTASTVGKSADRRRLEDREPSTTRRKGSSDGVHRADEREVPIERGADLRKLFGLGAATIDLAAVPKANSPVIGLIQLSANGRLPLGQERGYCW